MYKLLGLLIFSLFLVTPPQQRFTSEVAFCNFELPDEIKRANASFNVSYSFEINEKGEPVKIVKLHDDYVGEDKVASCLSNWRFHGFRKGGQILANFYWKHGEGWAYVSVSGPEFVQKIKVTGNPCPYLRRQ